MEAPLFASHLGYGRWIGIQYALELCPICQSFDSLIFEPDGTSSCSGCETKNEPIASFKQRLMQSSITGAQLAEQINLEKDPDGLIVVSEYRREIKPTRIGTGFKKLDMMLGGLGDSGLTVLTGKRGEGKSTWSSNMVLNAIQDGHNVCFYSGELSASTFQAWMFAQAAGDNNMDAIEDNFGNEDFVVNEYAEARIRAWLKKKLILYDNSLSKHSERNAILERFKQARRVYGCDLFVVDNLMTAKYTVEDERNYWRAQSNFAGELKDFAQENLCHVILVAHPKKGDSGDINDDVSGSSDITNRADNVIQVKKLDEKGKIEYGADSLITVSKNRDYGRVGKIRYNFCPASRRFVEVDSSNITKYGWEDLC